MSSQLKPLHLRNLLLAAGLILSLPVALRSDDAAPATPAPAASASSTPVPNAAAIPTPDAKTLPATGGPGEPDGKNPKTVAPTTQSPAATPAADSAAAKPITIPALKPIDVHYDRDAEIGHIVGELLENNHYLQTPITPDMSQRWLKNYFLALDPTHLFFLQGDVDEFTTKYGNTLGQQVIHGDNDKAIMQPAFEIFNRYLQRVNENVRYAEKLVKNNYDFSKDETYSLRTQKSPLVQGRGRGPGDVAAAGEVGPAQRPARQEGAGEDDRYAVAALRLVAARGRRGGRHGHPRDLAERADACV